MILTINGTKRELEGIRTVADLLVELQLDRRQVVVELNEKILRRDHVDEIEVGDRDVIEILRFVGGG